MTRICVACVSGHTQKMQWTEGGGGGGVNGSSVPVVVGYMRIVQVASSVIMEKKDFVIVVLTFYTNLIGTFHIVLYNACLCINVELLNMSHLKKLIN